MAIYTSELENTNALLHSINYQSDIDKIYLYTNIQMKQNINF